MASMTDVIFLLLIFFMVTSTVVVPNAIKVTLPQSKQQTAIKPMSSVTIDKNLNYYVTYENKHEKRASIEDISLLFQELYTKNPDMHIALYADESIPYKKIVEILNIANINKLKIVLATRPPKK